jgi:hypothetical protein
MTMGYTSTFEEVICGIPCKVWLNISQLEPSDKPHDIYCSISLPQADILLATAFEREAMLIRPEDMQESVDVEIALSSAEHMINLDSLRKQAYNKLRKLENIYAEMFGVDYHGS